MGLRKREIRLALTNHKMTTVSAYLVPTTDGIFAVHSFGKDWKITHVPTGRYMGKYAARSAAINTARIAWSRIRRRRLIRSANVSEARKAVPNTVGRFFRDREAADPAGSQDAN